METPRILDQFLSETEISVLDLDPGMVRALSEKGYSTVGDIYDLQSEGIALVLDIEFAVAQPLWAKVLDYISNPDNWDSGTKQVAKPDPEDLIPPLHKVLGGAIKEHFSFHKRDRIYQILVHRFGLYSGKEYTLEDLGAILSITRERVRQLEAKGLRDLRQTLLNLPQGRLIGDPTPITSEIVLEVKTIRDLLENTAGPVRTEQEIFQFLESRYRVSLSSDHKAHLRLLFTVFEWDLVHAKKSISLDIDPAWIVRPKEIDNDLLVDALKKIGQLLFEETNRVSYLDIKESIGN